jgi:hypothetical protein
MVSADGQVSASNILNNPLQTKQNLTPKKIVHQSKISVLKMS